MIRVRLGLASYETDGDAYRPPWIQHWANLVTEIAGNLPDIDMVINHMDENRLLVPWVLIKGYIEKEQKERKMPHPDDTTSTYGGLAFEDSLRKQIPYDPHWISGQNGVYWDHLRATCSPGSPIQNVSPLPSFDVPIEYPLAPGPYTYGGYTQNFTASQDPCVQPHLRGMHGTFIESVSMSTSHELFPMFAGSKLLGNNEILIPGAIWGTKKDRLIWRGAASGGRNKPDSWWHFHRHRWVQMMNGTSVTAMEAGDVSMGQTFRLPPAETYLLPAQKKGKLGSWLQSFTDVGFIVLECVIQPVLPGECEYTTPYFKKLDSVPMKEQYNYKYLPDVDGNSFSARWRGFLLSTSMPLKANIYSEWHDDRIMPWVHFVPFDSSYMDIYGIMEYFLNGHDLEAERIAIIGKQWADSVYRREDMRLYVWRLLLEYARVVDDSRDWLGFVDDIR